MRISNNFRSARTNAEMQKTGKNLCFSLVFRRSRLLRESSRSRGYEYGKIVKIYRLRHENQLKIEPRSPKIHLWSSFGVIFDKKEYPRAPKSVQERPKSVPRVSQERPKSGFIVSIWLCMVAYGCVWLHVVVVQRRWEAGVERGGKGKPLRSLHQTVFV